MVVGHETPVLSHNIFLLASISDTSADVAVLY